MPQRPPVHRPQGWRSSQQRKAEFDRSRESASERGYGHRWQKASKAYLKAHPLCEPCERTGFYHAAEVVDHKIPHKGDMKLFWDRQNWQAMNKVCHDRKTAKEDSDFLNSPRRPY